MKIRVGLGSTGKSESDSEALEKSESDSEAKAEHLAKKIMQDIKEVVNETLS